jgi:hypothetical protein
MECLLHQLCIWVLPRALPPNTATSRHPLATFTREERRVKVPDFLPLFPSVGVNPSCLGDYPCMSTGDSHKCRDASRGRFSLLAIMCAHHIFQALPPCRRGEAKSSYKTAPAWPHVHSPSSPGPHMRPRALPPEHCPLPRALPPPATWRQCLRHMLCADKYKK